MTIGRMKEVASPSLALPAVPVVWPFSATDLLHVWERGQRESPVEKALTMLSFACPDMPREALAALSIGQRDACLIELREKLFGSQLSSLADCPGCGERLEMDFRVSDIRAPARPELAQPLSVKRSGYELSFRLPNSLDLMELPGEASVTEMRGRLFERCLLGVQPPGRTQFDRQASPELPAEIPAVVIEAAIVCMSEADAQADVQLKLTCPCCERQWKAAFDIVSYLWSELQERAAQLLREVHLLASAYGWREAEILALSPWRRQCYLEMLTG